MASTTFARGEHILYRGPHVDDSGKTGPPVICDVKPVIVVEDTPSLILLYIPAGSSTLFARPIPPGRPKPWAPGEWELVSGLWDRWHCLYQIIPGEWRATWMLWSPTWEFVGWYVNLQEPLWRTRWGFDIRDLQLDILVAPERTWRWKDEDDFQRSMECGLINAESADNTRESANDSIGLVESARSPFDDTFRMWRPDPNWGSPQLPIGASLDEVLSWSSADALEQCLAPTSPIQNPQPKIRN